MQTNSEELFLRRIAQELIDQHGKDLHRIIVVLPSNRSKVFLKKFLFEILGSAFLTPQLTLLPQFVKSVVKERTEENIEIFLGGMYNEVKDFGLGFAMISKSIEEANAREFKHLYTHVSTNNIEVLRLYMKLGFHPLVIKNVFIKHSKLKKHEQEHY